MKKMISRLQGSMFNFLHSTSQSAGKLISSLKTLLILAVLPALALLIACADAGSDEPDVKSSDAKITELTLTISEQDITVTFDSEGQATVNVSHSPSEDKPTDALIKSMTLSTGASATDGSTSSTVVAGDTVGIRTESDAHDILLNITAEDGSERSYTITLNYLSSDAKIDNLELEILGITKEITFDADNEGSFAISVLRGQVTAATVTALTISDNARATDSSNAEVSANSMVPVTSDDDGDRFILTVTAGDGTIKTYTIQVTYTAATSINTLTTHTQAIRSISFNGDGTRLASGSTDNSIRVWDMTKTSPTSTRISGHGRNVKAVAFSPDGNRLASGGQDGGITTAAYINIWDMTKATPTSIRLEGHTGVVWSVAFNEAGTRLASGSSDDSIRIWDVTKTTPTSIKLSGHTNYVYSVAFNKAGTRLASGSSDNFIRIWDVTKTTPTSIRLTGHTSVVRSVAFNEAGTRLASGSSDNSIRIWDVTKTTPTSIKLDEHTDIVHSVAFNKAGTRLASGSSDKSIRIWDMTKTTPTSIKLDGHTDIVYSVAFNEDGTKLASGSSDNSIRIWE